MSSARKCAPLTIAAGDDSAVVIGNGRGTHLSSPKEDSRVPLMAALYAHIDISYTPLGVSKGAWVDKSTG